MWPRAMAAVGPRERLTSPRRFQAKLRAAEAFKLYAGGGWTYEQIAARLGYGNRSSAWCAVQRHYSAAYPRCRWPDMHWMGYMTRQWL